MIRRLLLGLLLIVAMRGLAQDSSAATRVIGTTDTSLTTVFADTTPLDLDELFSLVNAFADSIEAGRSFFMADVGLTRSVIQTLSNSTALTQPHERLVWQPSVAYYHRSGFGLSSTAYLMQGESGVKNPYQLDLTGSYDHFHRNRWVSGIAYSRYLTRKNLPFYTSPLQNEIYGYFTYRKFFIRPSVGLRYGWGSRTTVTEQDISVIRLRLRQNGYVRIDEQEKINDLTLSASIRHDHYFRGLFSKGDYLRLTPQLTMVWGTQSYGFNQTYNAVLYANSPLINPLTATESFVSDSHDAFQPVIGSLALKAAYMKGIFYLQPQASLGYYFPSTDQHWVFNWLVSAGVIF